MKNIKLGITGAALFGAACLAGSLAVPAQAVITPVSNLTSTDSSHLQVWVINTSVMSNMEPFVNYVTDTNNDPNRNPPGDLIGTPLYARYPDVVIAQEVGTGTTSATSCDALALMFHNRTNEPYDCRIANGATANHNNAPGGAAIVYRTDRLTFDSQSVQWLKNRADVNSPCAFAGTSGADRWLALIARFHNFEGTRHVVVGSVHMPTQDGINQATNPPTGTQFAQDCSKDNTALINTAMNAEGNAAIQIVGGDWNYPDWDNRTGQNHWAPFYGCANKELAKTQCPGTTQYWYDPIYDLCAPGTGDIHTCLAQNATHNGKYDLPIQRRRIDFLFYNDGTIVNATRTAQYAVTLPGAPPDNPPPGSDHNGIGALLLIP
jgi:hypothetical protein